MKSLVFLLTLAAAGHWTYVNHYASPLLGEWQSNKNLTLEQWKRDGVDEQVQNSFKSILGIGQLSISPNTWRFSMGGQTESNHYRIISDNGTCYKIELREKNHVACVRGDQLQVSIDSVKSKEIFTRM